MSQSPIHQYAGLDVSLKETSIYVVDGQQRLSALAPLSGRPFQLFVSCLVCENTKEL